MPVRRPALACAAAPVPVPAPLRPLVHGAAAFGRPGAPRTGHRLLPLALTTVVLDFDTGDGVVTGPRGVADVEERERWGHGISVALTPAGVRALLGVRPAELAGATVRLPGCPSLRHLTAHFSTPPPVSSAGAFRALETRAGDRDGLLDAAWRLLHRPGARPAAVAERLHVSRRLLERVMRTGIGLSPGEITRIARVQHATGLLALGIRPAAAAARAGYSDQAHLTRRMRDLVGLTPGRLCAIVQDRVHVGRLPSPS